MSCFSTLWQNSPEFNSIVKNIHGHRLPMGVLGLSPVHKAHVIAALCDTLPRCAVVITPDEAAATRLRDDLQAFGANAVFYPARDLALRPSESRSREFEHARLNALDSILEKRCDMLVCSVEAAMQLTVPPDILQKNSFTLAAGDDISVTTLVTRLLGAGFTRAAQVDGPGQFAQRGGIVDVFPPQHTQPMRVEFWGETIDTIAPFDPETQRRGDSIAQLRIIPANEIVPESTGHLLALVEHLHANVKGKGAIKMKQSLQGDIALLQSEILPQSIDRYLPLIYSQATVLDYLETDGLVLFCESFNIAQKAQAADKLALEDLRGYVDEGTLTAGLDKFALRWPELLEQARERGVIYMDNLPRGSFDTPVRDLVTFTARQTGAWNGLLDQLAEDVAHLKSDYACVVFAGTDKAAKTLVEDLNAEGHSALYCPVPPATMPRGIITCMPGTLSAGAEYPHEKVLLITYGAMRGKRQQAGNKSKKAAKNAFNSLGELRQGDYVVHRTHGVGMFEGINTISASGVDKDYIQIRYNKGDMLYLPVTQLDQVTRYVGSRQDGMVKLNRLGGAEWKKSTSRASAAVKDWPKNSLHFTPSACA